MRQFCSFGPWLSLQLLSELGQECLVAICHLHFWQNDRGLFQMLEILTIKIWEITS